MRFVLKDIGAVETDSPEKLAALFPEEFGVSVVNYGQGEGQINIEGREWGVYWGPDLTLVLEVGEITWQEATRVFTAFHERASAAGGRQGTAVFVGNFDPSE